ncbi:MAG: hypothetical protein FWH56_03665 [Betaproteobacteria bacterium]|nr:hypothetical protein [Betaproteobacteria bacterium]
MPSEFFPVPGADLLEKIANAGIDKVADLLGMRLDPGAPRLKQLSDEERASMREVEERAIFKFTGSLDQLESALGMLRLGHHFGWRVLYVMHSKKTIRNYESILDIRIRDYFPEEGPSSGRSVGLSIAKRFTNFWKVVSGDIKIPRRRDVIP